MRKELIEELKKTMEYVDGSECCSCCEHFRPRTDGFALGIPIEEPRFDRCTLSVVEVPVSAGGRCKFYRARKPFFKVGEAVDIIIPTVDE